MSDLLYPRLPYGAAEELRLTLPWDDGEKLARNSGTKHPSATFAPTGGTRVSEAMLQELADAVRGEVTQSEGKVTKRTVSQFDLEAGRVLHSMMGIIPADAAASGVWAFLALVLLPDVAALRFKPPRPRDRDGTPPRPHPSRVHGGPRNVFRRPWWRWEILGDQLDVDRPLGEDELVGIFERSSMARCRPLARVMAQQIVAYEGSQRSAYARELSKRVRRLTGPRLLDILSYEDLRAVVLDAHRSASANAS